MKILVPLLPLALAACSTTRFMRDAEPTAPPGPDETPRPLHPDDGREEAATLPAK